MCPQHQIYQTGNYQIYRLIALHEVDRYPRPSRRKMAKKIHFFSELQSQQSLSIQILPFFLFIYFYKVAPRQETLIRAWCDPDETHPSPSPIAIPHAAQICPSAACLANLKKKKKLPQSTQKPRLVSHTLAAKSPQGRGGDEAECLLVAVKS